MSETITVTLITGIFSVIAIILNNMLGKKKRASDNIKLKNHPFYARAEILKNHIEHTFTLDNKGKEVVFKDIIKSQISTFQTVLLKVSEDIDNKKIVTSTELYNRHLEALDEIISLHHSYYKSNIEYTVEEQNVLNIVMKKYDMWHESKINFLQDNIMNVCNSPFYDTELIKGAVVLDLYLSMAVDTINDASKTLNRLNGDIKGLVFRGVTI